MGTDVSRREALRVLALCPFPGEAANTRFRLLQLVPLLEAQGVAVTVRPFMDAVTYRALYQRAAAGRTTLGLLAAAARRVGDVVRARGVDVVLVLREAMLAGPPMVEMLAAAVGRCAMVLDLDDPTWISYDSPTYGWLGRVLKWPGKTLTLIDRAAEVTCGNQVIADFVAGRGRPAAVIPAAVDTAVFRPRAETRPGLPLVGWVGTHSSFRYLDNVLPVLGAVAKEQPFRLLVVGAGTAQRVALAGVDVEDRAWELAREPDDFASLDVGLYPLADDEWARGKSALKSVQYLACGVPFVASPVGAAAEIGVAGATHLLASGAVEWREALSQLLSDPDRRAQMGVEGRNYALARHGVAMAADLMGSVLRRVAA